MARPRKEETLTQTSFRLPESDLALIKEAAAEMGMGTSAFIRMAAIGMVYATNQVKVTTFAMQIAQAIEPLMTAEYSKRDPDSKPKN
jgi:sporulation-control protein spo0M